MQNRDKERIYINECISNKRKVTIIMKNGYQMRGTIIDQDDFSIVVNEHENRNLLYKGAISTIIKPPNIF